MVVRGSGEKASGCRSSGHQSEEETEGPETASWVSQPGSSSGLPAALCGPIGQLLQLGTAASRHDQRISSRLACVLCVACVLMCVRPCGRLLMTFPEPAFHILPESVRLEQSEDGGDSSAGDQAAQHPAGNRHLTGMGGVKLDKLF